jgi:hypothetical protein
VRKHIGGKAVEEATWEDEFNFKSHNSPNSDSRTNLLFKEWIMLTTKMKIWAQLVGRDPKVWTVCVKNRSQTKNDEGGRERERGKIGFENISVIMESS